LAKNLFHRAISESGVSLTAALITTDVKPIAGVSTATNETCVLCSPGVLGLFFPWSSTHMLRRCLKGEWLRKDCYGFI
jgi:carboxylesterase 1